jgi:hypothetical protein
VGTEYTLRAARALDHPRLDRLLRSLPHFAAFPSELAGYEFRDPENPGNMPNVCVKLESTNSVYVCDYGGALMAAQIIGAVMLECVHEGAVELRILE